MGVCWLQSRYDKAGPGGSGADYINCPLDKAEYEAFIAALLAAEKTAFKEFEGTPYFEGCLPIEVMAERGPETLRFGPMKPVGLSNPHRPGVRPHAVVQLRQDNALGTLWNMVGFQTKLKHGEQTRVFRMIPGLAMAEFARLGGLHRNTFLNSPKLLDAQSSAEGRPATSTSPGRSPASKAMSNPPRSGSSPGASLLPSGSAALMSPPPPTTALGALLAHITGGHLSADGDGAARSFQPMNVNFGLFPPIAAAPQGKRGPKGLDRKRALAARALADLDLWLARSASVAAE